MNWRMLICLLPGLLSCLSDPELPTCAEFEFGTDNCGTPCEVYCELMLSDCSEVYATEGRCMNDCANEPVTPFVNGTLGDESGNSLACRISYALESQCEQAGLRDSRACASASCTDYCDLMIANCNGAYPSVDNCMAVCETLPRGTLGVDANTVECRFGYAEATATDPTQCDAASVAGGNVCGDPCEVYCDTVELNCAAPNTLYADRATCLSTCNLLDTDGGFADWDFSVEVDTLQCRIYHAGPPAALEPASHCNHARVYNSIHCGNDPNAATPAADWPCNTYCDLVMEHCSGLYPDEDTCLSACAQLPEVVGADPAKGPAIYPVSSLDCPM